MTDSNLRSEASAGVSADAISDRHAVVRIELAVAIKWRRSPAEQRTRTMHTAGARVETMISRTVRIDPFGRRACGAPDEDQNGGETAHVHILPGAQPSEIPERQLHAQCSRTHHVGRALVCPTRIIQNSVAPYRGGFRSAYRGKGESRVRRAARFHGRIPECGQGSPDDRRRELAAYRRGRTGESLTRESRGLRTPRGPVLRTWV